MKAILYPDLIWAINLLADMMILYLTARLMRESCVWWRILLAGSFGSAASLIILILGIHGIHVNYVVSVISLEILMIAIAFSIQSTRKLILLCGCHLLTAVMLHGILYLLMQVIHMEFLCMLLFAGLILWLLYQGYARYRMSEHDGSQIYTGILYWDDRSVMGKGFVDTGNTLIDPVSGRSVIIADSTWIQPILPDAYQEMIRRYMLYGRIDYDYMADRQLDQVRVIPYRTIGEEDGNMLAIRCQRLVITNREVCYKYAPAIIGISRTAIIQGEEYQMILPNRLS